MLLIPSATVSEFLNVCLALRCIKSTMAAAPSLAGKLAIMKSFFPEACMAESHTAILTSSRCALKPRAVPSRSRL
ncbi:hypothetical protein BJX99DRAFT_236566, partial [Aspergillus californicus]